MCYNAAVIDEAGSSSRNSSDLKYEYDAAAAAARFHVVIHGHTQGIDEWKLHIGLFNSSIH